MQAFTPATLLKRDTNLVFSCKICEIFKNTYFGEHLQESAFGSDHEAIASLYSNSSSYPLSHASWCSLEKLDIYWIVSTENIYGQVIFQYFYNFIIIDFMTAVLSVIFQNSFFEIIFFREHLWVTASANSTSTSTWSHQSWISCESLHKIISSMGIESLLISIQHLVQRFAKQHISQSK